MIIGLPREIKIGEGRVALTPADIKQLVASGYAAYVTNGAGKISGFSDNEYKAAGATMGSLVDIYKQSDLIVKVKEPQTMELGHLRKNQILFSFLHLAACLNVTEILQRKNITAAAFETVENKDGRKPILYPMSIVAGRLAVQTGMDYLKSKRGLLISDAKVTVIGGAGVAGSAAVCWLRSLGARVSAVDRNAEGLYRLQDRENLQFLIVQPAPENIAKAVAESDLVILAAAIHGAATPKLVTRKMVASMKPNSILVDISIDQGGGSETSRPTTLAKPIYMEEGVIHYCVPNMPGSVPRSSTSALSKAVLPYLLKLVECFDSNRRLNKNITEGAYHDLYSGIQVYQGKITNAALASSLNKTYWTLALAL